MNRSRAPRRIAICDDSRTYATALAKMLLHGREFEVVGVYRSAEEAILALPRAHADLLTMNIELPGMSGIDAVEQIMSVSPLPILVVSAHARQGNHVAAALAAGALEAVAKDELDLTDLDGPQASAFRRRVHILSGAKVIRHPRARLPRHPPSARIGRTVEAIGICASTGGPQALAQIVCALPESFPIPLLAVQHIASGFTDGLVGWLAREASVPVALATDGALLRPGVWIAPESAHLIVDRGRRLRLDRAKRPGLHEPSADTLFESLAESLGSRSAGVVLTGMGRDGAAGVRAIRNAGGFTIAQDEGSSVIFGMPRAAIEAGAEIVLPLTEIAPRLIGLAARLRGS